MSATKIKIDLNACLDNALKAAAPDGGSYLAGKHTFWSEIQNGSIGDALDKALKAAAPDGGSYLAGESAFWAGFTGRWRAAKPAIPATDIGARVTGVLKHGFGKSEA